ncbi:MAG: CcmD family protein [Acidobacteriota bacterium]
MNDGGLLWLAAANLIIWTGLFLYLLRIERAITQQEDES